uniref:Uncharacterized protein n=3 Tax=Lotharella globosa TaxID=91324 RepID=A0A7S3YK86_9EUKA|mmetsp:Transcript_23103/g.46349  ORF Transcript_23103/g.46349 Transcript_23103/m.46349 type:complete len:339 (-) Transcript_23103:919-1935(-)
MATFSETRLSSSRDTLWLHRNRQHYGKRDPVSWLNSRGAGERSSACLGNSGSLQNWMEGKFFSHNSSPHTVPRGAGAFEPLKPVARANPQKRLRQGSLLELASEQDQKLVQRILEVLKTHNGHFRRLSWTNHSRFTESTDTLTTQSSSSSTCTESSSIHLAARPIKRLRRVTFHETNEVRFISHEETDYGLPMMSAIPGTGNGITNPNSEWHNRPHTGWYNKYVGACDRPRWWFYDCELKAQAETSDSSSPTSDASSSSMDFKQDHCPPSTSIYETPSKATAAPSPSRFRGDTEEENDQGGESRSTNTIGGGSGSLDEPLSAPARCRSKKRKRGVEEE